MMFCNIDSADTNSKAIEMFLKIRYLECAYVCTIKKLKRDKTAAVNLSLT